MSEELPFHLLEKAQKQECLFEKFHLSWFSQNGVPVKKTTTQKSQKTISTTYINLGESIYLLVKAPLQEFFLAYSILIGDKTQMYKAKLLDGGHLYFEEKYLEEIKDKLIHSTIEKVKIEELFEKPICWHYKKPKVLEHINAYVKEKKELDLNTLHVQKGEELELFVPTLKKNHFDLAKKMSLPLFPLLDKGFLDQQPLNLFDTNTLIEHLQPLYNEKVSFTQRIGLNGELIYRDVEKQLHVLLPQKNIASLLENVECRNVSKETLIEELYKKKSVQIGSRYFETVELPLWKSSQGIFTFEDEESFEKHAGLPYNKKKNELESIYLVDSQGDVLHFPNYHLNTQLKGLLYSFQPPVFHFSTYEEIFILAFLYEEEFPFSILVKAFEIDNQKINELSKICSCLLSKTLHYSLSTLKLPQVTQPSTPLEYVLAHYVQELSALRNTYVEEAKEMLVEDSLKSAQNVLHYSRIFSLTQQNSFFYLEYIRGLVKTLMFLNKEYQEYENTLYEYFKDVRSTYHLPLEDNDLKSYTLYLLAENYSKYTSISIYAKNTSSLVFSHFSNPNYLEKEKANSLITRIDKKSLKKAYPNSYKDILSYYSKNKTLPETIRRGTKTIPIDRERYLDEIPVFRNKTIKGVCKDFIFYIE